VAVAEAPPGSVLVVNVGHEPARGYWGEVLTTGAEARGLRGLVIDGGVRDVDALETHAFAVFSTMIALRGATKQEPGNIGGTAVVGDVEVARGDWIVGDADGVVVVPHAHLDAVLEAGRARAEKEEHYFAELRSGRTTMQLLSLDDVPIDRL
jgi:4-hydroxy-4-methyl-2-oxoglutarate aldolase